MRTVGEKSEASAHWNSVARIIYRTDASRRGKPVASLPRTVTDMSVTSINSAGVQYVRDHLASFPRPDREAAQAIRDWASKRKLQLDPDQLDVVTLHYRADGPQGYQAVVMQRLSLTQAVLGNWQGESNNNAVGALFSAPWAGTLPDAPIKIVEHLATLDTFDNSAPFLVFNGLFQRSEPARYDHSTLVQLPAEQFQHFIDTLDFSARYKAQLDRYWEHQFERHRLCTKLNFIAACNKQVVEGRLSDPARKLAWRAAGLIPRGRRLRLSTLSVYGYASTDLLYINDASSDLTLLYLPGNSSPILEFASAGRLKDWFGKQCQDPSKRQRLKQHFNLADGPDGLDFSGLDTALAGLGDYPAVHRLSSDRPGFTTDGRWSPRDYVNYRPAKYNAKLSGDVFAALTERQRLRSYADGEFIITSDSEVTKAKWRGYLASALNLLAPMALVVPELAPLFALGGVAQLGLGIDRAIHGKSAQAKAEGVETISYGLFNATPLAIEGAGKIAARWRTFQDGFVYPQLVNEQLGYPLSPVDPPRLPDSDVARFFHDPSAIAPLPGHDEAVANAVLRVPRYDGTPDKLTAVISGYPAEMVYDVEHDVFIRTEDSNEVEPTRYIAMPNTLELAEVTPAARPVSNPMRSASLRALGVDLPLPVELPPASPPGATPIPKKLFSLWVGDNVISPQLLDNVAGNVQRLHSSEYSYRLYLSNANPTAFAENLRQLGERAPALEVLELEQQPFFARFRQSKYYPHYRAALDGNGGVGSNFASASDVLRYPLLYQDGGLYIDMDDRLLPAEGGAGQAHPATALAQMELATTAQGLILPPPMSNEKMAMNCLFNTSIIGSHPGNPTLLAISEAMHQRFLADPDFYLSRPTPLEEPEQFHQYARRLSQLTGPAMFTAVVDQQLPDLYRLRQVMSLFTFTVTNVHPFVVLEEYQALIRRLLPLNRIARVGAFHSWARP